MSSGNASRTFFAWPGSRWWSSTLKTACTASLLLTGRTEALPAVIGARNSSCDLDFCANAARELKIDYAVKNSFGFGGTNGTLVFARI